MKPSDLLPAEVHYLASNHPGTGVWRHARTPLTPAYPRWAGEGMSCEEPGCDGKLTTYKLCPTDTGIDPLEDWEMTGSEPAGESYAGDWICSRCHATGAIALREVQQHRDDVPRRPGEENVVPLFGPRGYDRGEALRAEARLGPEHWTGEDGIDWTAETAGPIDIDRQAGNHRARRVDLCGTGADRVPVDALDTRPGLAPGGPARRARRADLLGGDGAAAREHTEPPEEVTP